MAFDLICRPIDPALPCAVGTLATSHKRVLGHITIKRPDRIGCEWLAVWAGDAQKLNIAAAQ